MGTLSSLNTLQGEPIANGCAQCNEGHCRLRHGDCAWSFTDRCSADLGELRTADLDAWAFLQSLIEQSQASSGLRGHHVSPMAVPSSHLMGELKAKGREMYRLYYGEPDQDDDSVVGLSIKVKRTFDSPQATRQAQDRDIRTSRDIFVTWLNANGMTSGA